MHGRDEVVKLWDLILKKAPWKCYPVIYHSNMEICFKMPWLVISSLCEHQFVHIDTQMGQIHPWFSERYENMRHGAAAVSRHLWSENLHCKRYKVKQSFIIAVSYVQYVAVLCWMWQEAWQVLYFSIPTGGIVGSLYQHLHRRHSRFFMLAYPQCASSVIYFAFLRFFLKFIMCTVLCLHVSL